MKKKNYNSRMEIRLSEHEKQALTTYANTRNQSVSELIRQFIRTLINGGNQ